MTNELLLLSGNDIPFPQASVTIHPLRLKEVAYLGEEVFYSGCELLKFSKDILSTEDKNSLSQYSDFQILMSILSDNSASMQNNVSSALMVLDFIFPLYLVKVSPIGISLFDRNNPEELCGTITEKNFSDFKQIIIKIFCLEKTSSETYNV